jgi:preprotein translocase subunit YajC
MTYLTILLQSQQSPWGALMPFLLIFVIMYFFMIRPQMRRQKKEKTYRESIHKGKRVVTNSGIHGKVVEVGDSTIVLEVQNGIRLKMEKSVISAELSAQYEKSEKSDD